LYMLEALGCCHSVFCSYKFSVFLCTHLFLRQQLASVIGKRWMMRWKGCGRNEVTSFFVIEALSRHLTGGSEETHKKTQAEIRIKHLPNMNVQP
jgi:hypothetical protein